MAKPEQENLEEDMSRGYSEWRIGRLLLLGSLLYNIPVIVVFLALAGWFGYSVEGRGILRGYSLVLYSWVYLSGLLICIGLILRCRWWGVVLAPAIGALSVLLI